MFGVPLELITKGRPEYALRQKGKGGNIGARISRRYWIIDINGRIGHGLI